MTPVANKSAVSIVNKNDNICSVSFTHYIKSVPNIPLSDMPSLKPIIFMVLKNLSHTDRIVEDSFQQATM